MEPGPHPTASLSAIDVDRLSGREVVISARAQASADLTRAARQYQALSRESDLSAETGDLDILRQIADQQRDGLRNYAVTDARTGEVYVGTTARRPTPRLRRPIAARYPTCVHPTCRRPVARCDVDHTEDWINGGLTTLCNLAPLCRYHHRNKHKTSWRYRKSADGTIEWTSQFGLKYLTHPPP